MATTSFFPGGTGSSIVPNDFDVLAAQVAAAAAAGTSVLEAAADAETFASQAATSATSAAASATSAGTQATNAATAATNAASSATSAASAATNASAKATEATNAASTATTQAATSATKATEAAASATNAATSATSSATSATNAASSATSAATSAATATTKASEAVSSATTATTKASEAATSATNAASSAASASTSATTATTKATEASSSATSAASSAVTATTQAGIATTKASEAASSASAAAASAAAAAAGQVNADWNAVSGVSQILNKPTIPTSKVDIGLGNVDNTSDLNKPISTATQTALNAKQDTLVSGTNIKTINSTSLLGSGNVAVQPTLVSGTNIKTINGTSLLGSGDITISSGATTYTLSGKTAAYTVVAGDNGSIINCTSGTFTVGATATATLGAGFHFWLWNTSATATDAITFDPNASETVDSATTLILRRGEGVELVVNSAGTAWEIGSKKASRGYAENHTGGYGKPVVTGNRAFAQGFGYNGVVTAGADSSAAIGTSSTGYGATTATGAGAMALGGSYASGADSFAAAVANNTSSYGATGVNSVAEGYLAKASGAGSSVLGGKTNTASATGSTVAGGELNTASASYSYTCGYYANAALYGKQAFASGRFAASGDAQSGKMVLRRQTTYSSPIEMTSDGAASGAANQIILPSDSTYAFRGLAVARNVGNDADSKVWEFKGAIRRGATAGSVALIGTPAIDLIASDGSAWTLSISTDSVNGGMSVFITGEAGKTINAVATVWTTEVTG